ncbi:MAG: MFS transporter, partial [Longimicrobiales bacterium]
LAIGTIVGALTLGKALPYLLNALPSFDYRLVILSASAAAVVGAALVAIAYRDGPFPFPRRPFSWGLVPVVLAHRETRLAIAGYLGHMWELYAMWSLIALYFFDFFTRHGEGARAASSSGFAAFAVIAVGAIGCVTAGRWADVVGRERVTIYAMGLSGTCALIMGHLLGSSLWLMGIVALVWGFSIVADSAQFSALVTETSPPHAVGTALTLQTSIGFLLTAISIPVTAAVARTVGWSAAFSLLAVGPALGIVAMLRLHARRHPRPAGLA